MTHRRLRASTPLLLVSVSVALAVAGCRDDRPFNRDAAVRRDAGGPVGDAGPPVDAGPRPDAGPARDAGSRDAGGGGVDAGTLPDGWGELRLVGGTASMGRLEVFYEGEWGTVCDDSFDTADITVACRQLGFSGEGEQFDATGGVDPIWMDDLGCTGSESRLADCPFNGWGVHNCGHSEDVGLTCF